MDKLKFYQIIALGMLLLNLVLLGFILLAGPPQQDRPGHALEELQLDDGQHDRFTQLAQAHQQQMRETNEEQRELLNTYFDGLINPDPVQGIKLPEAVVMLEHKKITSTYRHLLEVKEILRPEQVDRYPDFVRTAMRRILMQKENPQRPKETGGSKPNG